MHILRAAFPCPRLAHSRAPTPIPEKPVAGQPQRTNRSLPRRRRTPAATRRSKRSSSAMSRGAGLLGAGLSTGLPTSSRFNRYAQLPASSINLYEPRGPPADAPGTGCDAQVRAAAHRPQRAPASHPQPTAPAMSDEKECRVEQGERRLRGKCLPRAANWRRRNGLWWLRARKAFHSRCGYPPCGHTVARGPRGHRACMHQNRPRALPPAFIAIPPALPVAMQASALTPSKHAT